MSGYTPLTCRDHLQNVILGPVKYGHYTLCLECVLVLHSPQLNRLLDLFHTNCTLLYCLCTYFVKL